MAPCHCLTFFSRPASPPLSVRQCGLCQTQLGLALQRGMQQGSALTADLVDERPQAQAVDRLAQETVDVVTSTHRSILRTAATARDRVPHQDRRTPADGPRLQGLLDAEAHFEPVAHAGF